MLQTPMDVARFVVELLVLAVGVGYWAGEVKARKHRDPHPPLTIGHGHNGLPTIGELLRRLVALEQERELYFRTDMAERLIDESRRERADIRQSIVLLQKEWREVTSAIDRRIDRLMGQGS